MDVRDETQISCCNIFQEVSWISFIHLLPSLSTIHMYMSSHVHTVVHCTCTFLPPSLFCPLHCPSPVLLFCPSLLLSSALSYLQIWVQIWVYATSVFLVFAVTLSLFPAVISSIKSRHSTNSIWTGTYENNY